jgi:hypothetical protein
MSEVISFRLDKDNPREAQARAVLKTWVDKGYSVRHVLTEAMLAFGSTKDNVGIDDLSYKLDQISNMLQKNDTPSNPEDSFNILSDNFMASIRNAAKPGVSLG